MDLTNENDYLQLELTEEERVISQANEEMELFGAPLGAYALNDVGHAAIRSVVLPAVYELMEKLEKSKKETTEAIENSNLDNLEFEKELELLRSELSSVKSENFDLKLVVEDRDSKLRNCSNELLEAKNTIDDLNAKLAAATAPKVPVKTNVEGAHYIKPEKRAIYDVEYIGQFKNKYKAKFADTDEEFEDFSVYKDAKYKEVTAEEAPSFRIVQESVTEDDQRSSEVETEPLIVPQFQEEEDTSGSELVEESPSVVGQFITEERIVSIENDLARIKGMLRI